MDKKQIDKKKIKDILSSHADHLIGNPDEDPAPEAINEEGEDEELVALLGVAAQIQSTLTPITPNTTFEDQLKQELLTTAHLRRAEGYVPPNPGRDLLILAALAGLIIGLSGIWMFFRFRR